MVAVSAEPSPQARGSQTVQNMKTNLKNVFGLEKGDLGKFVTLVFYW